MSEKTKFLFVSFDALITDTAWQVVKEGHDVRYWIREKKARSVGEGFVPMSKDWKADAEWADVIVFDDVLGMGEDADKLRRAGKAVVGGTPYTDRLERRPRVRADRAQGLRHQHHPVRGIRLIRRSDRFRQSESRPLRHQAQRGGPECQTPPFRGRRRGRD